MGLPRLNSCCWVLDLQTGNIVIGCINALFSFIMFVIMIVASSMAASLLAEPPEGKPEDAEVQAVFTGIYAMSIILVFMFLAKFLFDLFFVYGVVTERAGIIRSYYLMWLVFFLLSTFTFFVNVTSYPTHAIIAELFYIGVNIYSVLLCHSYYKQLNEREVV